MDRLDAMKVFCCVVDAGGFRRAADRLGIRYWPSAANYVLVQVGETAPFVEALAAKQIHVRDRSNDPATPGCIRVTAGMVTHTDAAIAALESVVARRQSR